LSTMDGYRKGWATRYLREAKAELTAAKNTPYMAAGFIMEALTKAQAAIEEPILNFLVEIEKTLQQLAQSPKADNEKTMEHVNDIIEFTSEIVELFGGESS